MDNLELKYLNLKSILKEMQKVVVAYSGGVDSSFLLKTATDVLGKNSKGVLAVSPTFPSREYKSAVEFAKNIGAQLEVIESKETDNENFLINPENRCYFCKSELFNAIIELTKDNKYSNIVDGSNYDDLGDHRPGRKALKENGVRSPLQEARLTKNDIRTLSKNLGLPTWEKEALACLSSRFPYGERITLEKLKMVDQIEDYLISLNFRNIRARHQGKTLKIEMNPEDIGLLIDNTTRIKVIERAKEIGYTYVTLDLEGYRQGSMNETLQKSAVPKGELKIIN